MRACVVVLLGAVAPAALAADGLQELRAGQGVAGGAAAIAGGIGRDPGAFDGTLPSVSWSLGGDLSAVLGSAWRGDDLLPSIALRRRLLSQDGAGIDVAVALAFRSIGREDAGSEFSAGVLLARSLGAFSVSAAANVGKGVGNRADIDFDAASLAGYAISSWARLGAELRVRGELVDDLRTPEDGGRNLDLLAGPALSLTRGPWSLDMLAGWQRPRGAAPDRPAAVVAAACSF